MKCYECNSKLELDSDHENIGLCKNEYCKNFNVLIEYRKLKKD